jgi:hypothetical protein
MTGNSIAWFPGGWSRGYDVGVLLPSAHAVDGQRVPSHGATTGSVAGRFSVSADADGHRGATDPVGAGWSAASTPASGGQGYAYNAQVLPITQRITVSFRVLPTGVGTGADGTHVLPVQCGREGFSNSGNGRRWIRLLKAMPTGVACWVGVAGRPYPRQLHPPARPTPSAVSRGPGPGTAFIGGNRRTDSTPTPEHAGARPHSWRIRINRSAVRSRSTPPGRERWRSACKIADRPANRFDRDFRNVVVSGLPPSVQIRRLVRWPPRGPDQQSEVRNLLGSRSGTPVIPDVSQWSLVILATGVASLGSLVRAGGAAGANRWAR